MTACGLAVCWNVFWNVRRENFCGDVFVDREELIKFGSHLHLDLDLGIFIFSPLLDRAFFRSLDHVGVA